MIGIACCARTASGHAPAPASKPIKWRRVKSCNRIPCPPEKAAQDAVQKNSGDRIAIAGATDACSLSGPAFIDRSETLQSRDRPRARRRIARTARERGLVSEL